jgi:hypothetical protein
MDIDTLGPSVEALEAAIKEMDEERERRLAEQGIVKSEVKEDPVAKLRRQIVEVINNINDEKCLFDILFFAEIRHHEGPIAFGKHL